jgi:hypothetical protein
MAANDVKAIGGKLCMLLDNAHDDLHALTSMMNQGPEFFFAHAVDAIQLSEKAIAGMEEFSHVVNDVRQTWDKGKAIKKGRP